MINLKELFYRATHADWITGNLDTQYAIETTENKLTIKVQGSISWVDWVFNLLFWPFFLVKPYHNMPVLFFVHRGFLAKYKAIRLEIQKAVLENLEKEIEILAYSQGAAIGLQIHEDIVFTFGVRPKTILFGCPRVYSVFGFKMLSDRLKGVTRIENSNDIVTKLPFCWMFFKHYGDKIHIGSKCKWWKLSAKDHLPSSYRANMED